MSLASPFIVLIGGSSLAAFYWLFGVGLVCDVDCVFLLLFFSVMDEAVEVLMVIRL